jgi:hypothetical protein
MITFKETLYKQLLSSKTIFFIFNHCDKADMSNQWRTIMGFILKTIEALQHAGDIQNLIPSVYL